MDKLSKSISELSTDDSSTDKTESVISTDTSETTSVFELSSIPSSGSSTSSSTTSVKTRLGRRARSRRNKNAAWQADTDETSHSPPSTRSGKKKSDTPLKKLVQNEPMKFMENFNPEQSNRERKKLTRQISSSGKKKPTLYDEKGVLIAADVDLCDCLEVDCPGCHFPCTKCHSNKCGHECRQNRRWTYEEISVEGSDAVTHNPFLNIK